MIKYRRKIAHNTKEANDYGVSGEKDCPEHQTSQKNWPEKLVEKLPGKLP